MERQLVKCPVCGEWFNTTGLIMLQHVGKHIDSPKGRKIRALAELAARAVMLNGLATMVRFPFSIMYMIQAALCIDQYHRVLATPEESFQREDV